MLFSSIPFLFYFLPVVLLFYFVVPKQLKNAVLLLFSLIFYAWGEPKNVLLMLVAIILSYMPFFSFLFLLLDYSKKAIKLKFIKIRSFFNE